jgi:cytochrome c553
VNPPDSRGLTSDAAVSALRAQLLDVALVACSVGPVRALRVLPHDAAAPARDRETMQRSLAARTAAAIASASPPMSITHLKNALRRVSCWLPTRVHSTALRGMLLATALAGGVVQAAPKFEDTIAQRLQGCTACHGAQGRATPIGYQPRLEG